MKNKLDKLCQKGPMKNANKDVTAVFIMVENEELPEDQDYNPAVLLTMKPNDFADQDKRTKAQTLAVAIESALGGCEGIQISSVDVKSEQDVSIDNLRQFQRWDYDDLSVRNLPDDTLPLES